MMFDYSYITLYNLVFTSLPCIFAGKQRIGRLLERGKKVLTDHLFRRFGSRSRIKVLLQVSTALFDGYPR